MGEVQQKVNLEVKIEMLMERKKVESRDSDGETQVDKKGEQKEIQLILLQSFISQVFSGYFTWVTSYLMY